MRVMLAKILLGQPDLLLLDEPTNHLDLDALVWLEQWLKRFEGAMIVISHDRDFLDAVTHITLHIDQGQLQRYNGHYSQFERQRAERIQQQQLAYAKQQERMAHLQSFIARFKAKASKAKQAQSRVKALARMETIVPLLDDAAFAFEFHPPTRLPNPMLSLQSVSVGYASSQPNGSAHVILQKIHQSVLAGQRIGILGANGQGKSTLVKTITRNLPALAGHIIEGKGLNIGYFAQQELDVLEPKENPLAHMMALVKRLQSQGLLSGQALREADLRALQGGQASGCDADHLQAQSQAQAAAGLTHMARIAGVDLPREKRVEIGLTYIYGIGRVIARRILESAGVSPDQRVKDLTDADVNRLRQEIEKNHRVEGALRTEVAMNIKRLMDIGSYRGTRHRKGLPVRGQRTHTNARTKKGPRRAIAGKKKVTK